MILDQFAHAAARREEETPMSSLSDVGADTAIRSVVVHSSPSMYAKGTGYDERRCGVKSSSSSSNEARQIDRLVNDGIRGLVLEEGKKTKSAGRRNAGSSVESAISRAR